MITIYTSINSGGYDVQVWYDGRQIWSDRYQTREDGHKAADEWLDTSKYRDIQRVHKV